MKNKYLQNRRTTTRFIKKIIFNLLLVSITFFSSNFVKAQPTFVSAETNEGDGTSATVDRPATIEEGDLLVIGLMVEKGSDLTVNSVPADWMLIKETNNGTDVGLRTYYKVVGAIEPSTYTFGFSQSTKWASGVSRITGADPTTPIDNYGDDTGVNNPVQAPTIAASINTLVLCFYTNKKNATYNPSGTTTEAYDDPNDAGGLPSNMMAYFDHKNSGNTGERNATASLQERWASQQVVIAELVPLPVELVAYNGYAMERSNMLKWQTASEENTLAFLVERSLDGKNDFKEIDRVNAIGNSTVLRSYEIEDKNPLSLAYYRLRIVDFDGTFEYSDIIAVERSKTEISLVEIFPMPVLEEVTVLVHAQREGKAIMFLFDALGRDIKNEEIELKSGINRYTFSWEDHETSFYYLSIYNGKEKIVKKILRASRN